MGNCSFRPARRWAAFGASFACAITVLALSAAPGLAYPHLPTSTSLTSSTVAVSPTQTATITAKVAPGYFLLRGGSVTFSDTTTNTALGTVRVRDHCSWRYALCRATITVPGSGLAPGANQIVGVYSGDALEAPSKGSVTLYQGAGTNCTAGQTCDSGTQFSSDGTASADIFSQGPTSGNESIVLSFGTQPLPCTTPGTGDTLAFTVTNAGGPKFITYTVYGAAADAAEAANPGGNVCYESPTSFETASGAGATREPNGDYDGILPNCGDVEGDIRRAHARAHERSRAVTVTGPPCFVDTFFAYGDTPAGDEFQDLFETTESDPRASN